MMWSFLGLCDHAVFVGTFEVAKCVLKYVSQNREGLAVLGRESAEMGKSC